ncbi:MAG: rhodanese-like domain-containing protein [Desulfobacterales bacterium]|jgi:rhodanese-related sulfurtransferase
MRFGNGLLMIVIFIGLTGCSGNQGEQEATKHYRNVSVDQFVAMVADKDFMLINTHIPYEGEIPGTDLLIPFNAIEQHQAELPDDKTTRIVVYCKAGPMGDTAAGKLVKMGYTHVIHFKDGMNGWEKAGKSLQFRSR